MEKLQESKGANSSGEDVYLQYRLDTPMNIEISVSNFLISIGMSVHYRGYKYLKEIITYSIINNTEMESMTKYYSIVQRKYNASISGVERALRFAINAASQKEKFKNINNLLLCDYHSPKDYLIIGEFVNTIIHRFNIMKKYSENKV